MTFTIINKSLCSTWARGLDPSQERKDGGKGMVFPSLGGGTGGRKVSFILRRAEGMNGTWFDGEEMATTEGLGEEQRWCASGSRRGTARVGETC